MLHKLESEAEEPNEEDVQQHHFTNQRYEEP
jgi:hypothetical protein